MNFENNHESEPTINDFMRERQYFLAKWTAEGNKDAEPSIVEGITKEVYEGIIAPREGIARLHGIDDNRIER
ncbi:MAG: hypothetical protein ACK4SL_01200 [Candidatus Paceibacteria bacterium]